MKSYRSKIGFLAFVPAFLNCSIPSGRAQPLGMALQQALGLSAQGFQNLITVGRVGNAGLLPGISLDSRPLVQALSNQFQSAPPPILSSLAEKLMGEPFGPFRANEASMHKLQERISKLTEELAAKSPEAMQTLDLLTPIERSLVATLAPIVSLIKVVNSGIDLIPNPLGLLDSLLVVQVDAIKSMFPCSVFAAVTDQLGVGEPLPTPESCVGPLTTTQYQHLRDTLSRAPLLQILIAIESALLGTNSTATSASRGAEGAVDGSGMGLRGVLGLDQPLAPELAAVVNNVVQRIGNSVEAIETSVPSLQGLVGPVLRDGASFLPARLGIAPRPKSESSHSVEGDKSDRDFVQEASPLFRMNAGLPVIGALRSAASQAAAWLS